MTEVPAGLQKLPLAKAVAIAARATAARSPLPITGSLLLTPEEGAIRITGTNLEARIEALAEGSLNAPIAVPVGMLRQALNATQAPRLTVNGRSLTIEDDQLRIGTGRLRFSLHGYEAQDFPPASDFGDNAECIDFDLEALRWASRVAARDDSRPILTGACISESGAIACSDGFRLKFYGDAEDMGKNIVLPSRVVSAIAPDCERLIVRANRVQARFEGTYSLTTQLIQGTFPNYLQLIPKDDGLEWTADVDRPVLFAAVSYIANWMRATNSFGIVRITVSPDDMCLTARAADEMGEVEMHIGCKTEGNGKVAINGRYLLDALNCPMEKVLIKGYGIKSRLAFKYFDRIDIVMPMFVAW